MAAPLKKEIVMKVALSTEHPKQLMRWRGERQMLTRRFLTAVVAAQVMLFTLHAQAQPPPAVQSPQPITRNYPQLKNQVQSSVSKKTGGWCFLSYANEDWRLCNIHHHNPAEHGMHQAEDNESLGFPGSGAHIPWGPCGDSISEIEDDPWSPDIVEIHYVYVKGTSTSTCAQLRTKALKHHESRLGPDCPGPFVVRAVWARVGGGAFDPATQTLPDANLYVEYDGSSTGESNGAHAVHWKINRGCQNVSKGALSGVPIDPTREPQPIKPGPRTTKD
jgi:hypothetical protein